MATGPTPPDHGEDYFVLELGRVREQIIQKFVELIDCVKVRECKLLKELDTILASYHSYRDEVKKLEGKEIQLEKLQHFLQSELKLQVSSVKSMSKEFLDKVNTTTINVPPEPKMVHFVCDNNMVFDELNMLGKLVERVRSGIDYERKVHPIVTLCEKGNRMEQLYNPRGVTVDNKTGNIYVADCYNHCVKVFDSSGKILFKFGDSDGKGKMLFPKGLAISGDRIVITNDDGFNHNIHIYQLNGNFVSKSEKYGKGKVEFNYPRGLACNKSNGDIYICDYGNNRIQILSKELQFKSQFGADKLKHPHDVNLSKEYIFILDESNNCIHLYDYNLILQKSVVPRGEGMQVVNPCYFFIDNSNNILISDNGSNYIHIFNHEFELIHKINTSTHPMGVVVYNQDRVLVVCRADKDCLQIF